jgi:hypothetical protein
VHKDSFQTYLAARELSEKANIPAGWDIHSGLDIWIPIPDVTVQRLQEPPPKTKSPASPPKLKPRLD